MGKRGDAAVAVSSRVQQLVDQAAQAHQKPKPKVQTPAAVATPVRSKIAMPERNLDPPEGTPSKDMAATPARALKFEASPKPTPMSVQSTGTPLVSPEYKRLRAGLSDDSLPSLPSASTGPKSSALRRPDTQSTIADLNEQFASMTLRTGALIN